jgi:hypothetical protein
MVEEFPLWGAFHRTAWWKDFPPPFSFCFGRIPSQWWSNFPPWHCSIFSSGKQFECRVHQLPMVEGFPPMLDATTIIVEGNPPASRTRLMWKDFPWMEWHPGACIFFENDGWRWPPSPASLMCVRRTGFQIPRTDRFIALAALLF